MSEAMVVNSFLILRVFLVGGILLILPHVTRKGLLFGVYVGEEFCDEGAGRQLLRGWRRGCVALMTAALLVGLSISAAGWPVPGNLTGTAVLLLAAPVLYLRTYAKTRAHAPPAAARQASRATAPLQGGPPKGALFARIALGICLLVSFATLSYAVLSYSAMPELVPSVSGSFSNGPTKWSNKSFALVVFVPTLNLFFSLFFGVAAVLSSSAKLSVRGGRGGRSVEAQSAFRASMTRLSGVVGLLYCAVLTLFSVQLVRFQLAEISSLGAGIWVFTGILFVVLVGSLVRILKTFGQGGARLEKGSAETPLTGGLADDARWVWGLFYVDRDDPSLVVESRFGFGYTFNYGNRAAVLLIIAFLALGLAATTLGLIAFVS